MQKVNYYHVNIIMGLLASLVAATWLIGVPIFICRVSAGLPIPADAVLSSLAITLCGVTPCAWFASVIFTYYDNKKRNANRRNANNSNANRSNANRSTSCIIREKSLWLTLSILSNVVLSVIALYLVKYHVDLHSKMLAPTLEVWVIGGLTVFWILVFLCNRCEVLE